ncbi:MAG TPA: redoxin domain-containing protein [Pirellulales bacterium]|nr:redoxin domain-containing protein [Pirellulales bacterium]
MKLIVFVTCLLIAANVETSVAEQSEQRPQADDHRLLEVIDAIRTNEARYHNLETVVRIRKDWEAGSQFNVRHQEEVRHTIKQRELFWFQSQETQTVASGEKTKSERLTAFDGNFTRSIEFGNSVNVHTGRYEPPRMVPPHCWAISQLRVSSLPLSVYLSGMRAIQEDRKAFHSPVQRGRTFELARVETEIEGEETIEDLKCIKLRSRCWSRDSDAPTTDLIWLAPERNYLCVGSQWFIEVLDKSKPFEVSKVTEMREVAPGLWLPMRVEVRRAKRDSQGKPSAAVDSIETWTVEKAKGQAEDLASRLRDVKLPADLPRFNIGEDGRLDTSGVDLVKTKPRDPRELETIIKKLREEEQRYERLDVSLLVEHQVFGEINLGMPGAFLASEQHERTVAVPGKLYVNSRSMNHAANHEDCSTAEISAWDGHWLRSLFWQTKGRKLPDKPNRTTVSRNGPSGVNAFRPHTALFDDRRIRRRPLSELLSAAWYDEQNRYRFQVEYLGNEKAHGFDCKLVRLAHMSAGVTEPRLFLFLWLAPERNHLPVRGEWCDLSWSEYLPTGSTYVAKWREVTPGLWLPYHVVELSYDQWGRHGIGSGQIVLQSRRDRQIERATVHVKAADKLFMPVAPAGKISVVDRIGYPIGEIRLPKAAPATVPENKWRLMAATSPHDVESVIERETARKGLIGRPAPELVGERWLNGQPQTWDSLAGKIVVLFFWAEWCPNMENQLAPLTEQYKDLAESGIVVIGVHPAGSRVEEIQAAIKEFKIPWPICIDRARPDGRPWGALCESLQVEYLTDTLVIDAEGRIADQGDAATMVTIAKKLAKKP